MREPITPVPWPRRFPDRPFVLVSLSSTFQEQDTTLQRICDALAPLPLEVLITTGRGIAPETLAVSGCVRTLRALPVALFGALALVATEEAVRALVPPEDRQSFEDRYV
jgi:UDP:flavonoid glycosyltransferase YjiC (YdhE family)